MSTSAAIETPVAQCHPSLFRSDFERSVVIETHGFVSRSPRARRVGSRDVAMTGRVAFDHDSRRHLVEYADAEGVLVWMTAGGRPACAPGEGRDVGSVAVRFTDGTTRR